MEALQIFEFVLLLLAAILASNVINRFLPFLSTPIVQIVLGVIISFLYANFRFTLDPELFFVLFIAPLVFNAGKDLDKKTFWSVKGPIMNLAFTLVLLSLLATGYFVSWFIPAIPLAAAFVLIASLGPTDDVAVYSVSKRLKMPPKIMNILVGESLLNDVSGIICFQFALVAAVTGTFSITQAGGQFLIVGIGGIFTGGIIIAMKLLFVKWLRSLGMENVTFHILMELLTPFLVFMIAEYFGVSSILAVFTAGVVHSFGNKRLNPETADLNMASKNIWAVLSFTLEGLVFVILGTQLPAILKTILSDSYSIGTGKVILAILLITAIFTTIRFLWAFCTVRKKSYAEADYPMGKIKASLLISLSGARGAVTLASILSIPFLLDNGTPFPERDLILLISTGVIICSLLITNFILPLIVEKKVDVQNTAEEKKAYVEILEKVIHGLNALVDEDNKSAVEPVIKNYYQRIAELRDMHTFRNNHYDEGRELKLRVCEWEKQHTIELAGNGEIDEKVAKAYIEALDSKIASLSNSSRRRKNLLFGLGQHNFNFHRKKMSRKTKYELYNLGMLNMKFVLDQLKELQKSGGIGGNLYLERYISAYEHILKREDMRNRTKKDAPDEKSIGQIVSLAFQFELNNIQLMYENGRISREMAKTMRNNIASLELQIEQDEIG